MEFKPHDYQAYAIDFIKTHPVAGLFLGMGMGKTISTLTALNTMMFDSFQVARCLVVAPLRVARDTWPAELTKWEHLKHLRASVIVGTAKERRQAIHTDADIYVINRENLPWLIKELGDDWPYDCVVIDELSSFKNHKSARFKALMSRRKHMRRIIGLTGTPAPNSLEDLWAPFKLFDGGKRLLPYITHFRERYFDPDKRNGYQIFSWKLKPGAEDEIYEAISDVTVSMKTTDHLDLPPLATSSRVVHLDKAEREVYNQLKKDMLVHVDGEVIDAGSAAALSNKLLQLSSGAIYADEARTVTVHSQKIDALEDIIEAAAGNTVLVAYWFKHELERLLRHFPQGRLLSTAEDMSDWCSGKIPLAFIHPASAGHGLNLQSGGHILVWHTVPWSLELYEQTNARLFRQGQTEPVSIIHIEAANTIDQQVIKSLETKDQTQSALIEAVKAQLGD